MCQVQFSEAFADRSAKPDLTTNLNVSHMSPKYLNSWYWMLWL